MQDVPQPEKKCSLGVQQILEVCRIEVIPSLFLVDRERIQTWSLSRHNLVSWAVTLPRRQALFSPIKQIIRFVFLVWQPVGLQPRYGHYCSAGTSFFICLYSASQQGLCAGQRS